MDETMPTTKGTCSVDGCESSVLARGWCTKHYTRWQRNGDPLAVTRTPPMAADATEKMCPRCSLSKPVDQFGTRRGGKPKGYCKACDAAYQATHAGTPEGREMRRMARDRWNNDNHGYFLNYRYGITKDDYEWRL